MGKRRYPKDLPAKPNADSWIRDFFSDEEALRLVADTRLPNRLRALAHPVFRGEHNELELRHFVNALNFTATVIEDGLEQGKREPTTSKLRRHMRRIEGTAGKLLRLLVHRDELADGRFIVDSDTVDQIEFAVHDALMLDPHEDDDAFRLATDEIDTKRVTALLGRIGYDLHTLHLSVGITARMAIAPRVSFPLAAVHHTAHVHTQFVNAEPTLPSSFGINPFIRFATAYFRHIGLAMTEEALRSSAGRAIRARKTRAKLSK